MAENNNGDNNKYVSKVSLNKYDSIYSDPDNDDDDDDMTFEENVLGTVKKRPTSQENWVCFATNDI